MKPMTEQDWLKYPELNPNAFGTIDMDEVIVSLLHNFFKQFGNVIIHNAYELEGHAQSGYHPKKMAIDFHPIDSSYRDQFRWLISNGVGGVGYYPEWKPKPGWHIDSRGVLTVWKRQYGAYIYLF